MSFTAHTKTYGLIKKHRTKLLAFIVAIYSLPLRFCRAPAYSLDGSWIVAINNAVKKGLVFGQDFIFAYGPLGFLSTRDNEHISNFAFLAADLFLLSGFYHFIHKYVAPRKGWLMVSLIAMLLLRGAIYSQSLFLVFIIYAALNIKNTFSDYFELCYCAIAAILLFLIKINYGIIALGLLLLLAFVLLFKAPKKLIIFIAFTSAAFACFYFSVHIDIIGYIKYSLPLMRHYDEAMYLIKNPFEISFLSAMLLIGLLLSILSLSLASSFKTKKITFSHLLSICCLCLAMFLFYKNGFTRADPYHYGEFFATCPFFILAAIFITDTYRYLFSKIAIAFSIVTCGYNIILPDIKDNAINAGYYLSYLSPLEYFHGFFNTEKKPEQPIRTLSDDKLRLIGNASMDILPWEINLVHYYNFNYHPRPIPQSPAYAPALDSLNADHFYKTNRPEIVMFQNFPIDYHYCFWDESITKAVIRLNYDYIDFASMNGPHKLEDDPFDTYLLLRAKKGHQAYPIFEKLNSAEVKLNDTVHINYPGNEAIYMATDFHYSLKGKISRLLYQVPALNVILFFDDGSSHEYKAVVPIVKGPVLINKVILKNTDLINFFTGNLERNRNITAFVFHPVTPGFEPKYKVTFMKFSNY